MSKEQIIIDGVDVSGCVQFIQEEKDCCDLGGNCKGWTNCYYKQLKRKEQKLEELRQYHNKCCEENAKKETEWLEKYNQVSRDFYNGKYCNKENCSLLQVKEQECEKWQKRYSKLGQTAHKMKIKYEEQLDQLKAENEELTTINARLLGRLEVDETDTSLVFNLDKELRQKEKEFYTAIQKVVKLKQTLTEIKEIVIRCGKRIPLFETDEIAEDLKQILQKIREVDNEDS